MQKNKNKQAYSIIISWWSHIIMIIMNTFFLPNTLYQKKKNLYGNKIRKLI